MGHCDVYPSYSQISHVRCHETTNDVHTFYLLPVLYAEDAASPETGGAVQHLPGTATPAPVGDQDSVRGIFRGEIAQVRVWSSPCSEAFLPRLVGRAGVLDGDATLVFLWKVDEGSGSFLHNSGPLQQPKLVRGAKAATSAAGGGTGMGADGHAELVGEWEWVPCFDPDNYEGTTYAESATTAGTSGAVAASATAAAANSPVNLPPSSSSTTPRSGRQGGEVALAPFVVAAASPVMSPAAGPSTGTDTDLTRSLGWRSVSTAGDEECSDDQREGEDEEDAGDDGKHRGEGGRLLRQSPSCSTAGDVARAGHATAAAATAAGAGAALRAGAAFDEAALDGVTRARKVSAREALLGVLGKLFQQCSVYLAPCGGDPLLERLQPVIGGRTEARVQLQLVRREERAIKAVVQPEVCMYVFSLSMNNEQAVAGRDYRTHLARPKSQARTETGKYQFSLFSYNEQD